MLLTLPLLKSTNNIFFIKAQNVFQMQGAMQPAFSPTGTVGIKLSLCLHTCDRMGHSKELN